MACSMATMFDKNNKDESVLSKAVRSAAAWNASLNKQRNEERRYYLDLQSYTIMYPKGKKPITANTNPGNYPVALVPGQFSECYRVRSNLRHNLLPNLQDWSFFLEIFISRFEIFAIEYSFVWTNYTKSNSNDSTVRNWTIRWIM